LTRLRVSYISYICMTTHAISFFSSVSNCSRFQHPSFGTKTAAKIQPFSIPAKYFFNKKLNYLPTICISPPSKLKKIQHQYPETPPKRHKRGRETPFFMPQMTKKRKKRRKHKYLITTQHLTLKYAHKKRKYGRPQLETGGKPIKMY